MLLCWTDDWVVVSRCITLFILKLDFDATVKFCEATKEKLDRLKEQQREFTAKASKVKGG